MAPVEANYTAEPCCVSFGRLFVLWFHLVEAPQSKLLLVLNRPGEWEFTTCHGTRSHVVTLGIRHILVRELSLCFVCFSPVCLRFTGTCLQFPPFPVKISLDKVWPLHKSVTSSKQYKSYGLTATHLWCSTSHSKYKGTNNLLWNIVNSAFITQQVENNDKGMPRLYIQLRGIQCRLYFEEPSVFPSHRTSSAKYAFFFGPSESLRNFKPSSQENTVISGFRNILTQPMHSTAAVVQTERHWQRFAKVLHEKMLIMFGCERPVSCTLPEFHSFAWETERPARLHNYYSSDSTLSQLK